MNKFSHQATFQTHAQAICEVGRFLFAQGWCPATSSNFSSRLDAQHAAITASGVHKGELRPEDILCVNWAGQVIDQQATPSAETLLHTHLYQADAEIGAVLHTHSVNATVLSRLYERQGEWRLQDYEVLKALPGIETHESETLIPIFPNTQDIAQLSKTVDVYRDKHPHIHGYCIAGHGFYTWGRSLNEARRHIEAFEFLFECEVLSLRLGISSRVDRTDSSG